MSLLYCFNPYLNPPDDSCLEGYCSIMGMYDPVSRAFIYTNSIFIYILFLYNKAFKPEFITYVYLVQSYGIILGSLLNTSLHNYNRMNGVFILSILSSPLSIGLAIYSAYFLFFSKKWHSSSLAPSSKGWNWTTILEMILQTLPHVLTVMLLCLWFLYLFIFLTKGDLFRQPACDIEVRARGTLFDPFFFHSAPTSYNLYLPTLLSIFAAISWINMLFKQRDRLQLEFSLSALSANRQLLTKHHPVLFFCAAVVYPFVLWIMVIEGGMSYFGDIGFSMSPMGIILTCVPAIYEMCLSARLFGESWLDDIKRDLKSSARNFGLTAYDSLDGTQEYSEGKTLDKGTQV